MAVAGSVVIEMAANIARLTQDFDKARTEVSRQVGRIRSDVSSAMHGVEAIIAGLGIHALHRLVMSALNAGDEVAKMAKRTGVAAGDLQELQHAARLSGLSMETFEAGVTKLNRALGEAAAGNAQALNLFQDLGVEIRNAEGHTRGAGDVLAEVAERFKALTDPAERARLAIEAFGRGAGTQMIPLLEEGAEGIARLREEARRLGLVLDATMVADMEKAKDAVERMEAVVKAALTRMVGASSTVVGQFVADWTNGFAIMAKGIERYLPRRYQSLETLRAELDQVDAKLRTVFGRQQQSMNPFMEAAQFADLAKTRNEIQGLIRDRLALEAVTKKPLKVGPSAESLDAIGKLRQKVIDAAVPDPVAQSVVKFREEVEKLAAAVPSRADEIRGLGKAFEDVKAMVESAKQVVTDAQGAMAAQALGVEGSPFAGFEEVRTLASDVETFSKGIRRLAQEGVPVKDLFPLIQAGAQGLDARMAALEQRFANQPAVLARMRESLGALQFGGLATQLDAAARSLTGVQQAEAGLIDTAEGIDARWTPALRNGASAVKVFGDATTQLAADMGKVSTSVVKVTGDVQDLARAFALARLEAFLLSAETAGSVGAPHIGGPVVVGR